MSLETARRNDGPEGAPVRPGGDERDLAWLADLIEARRSVRRYAAAAVDRKLVERLCRAALWAPSNWNGQPWVFVVLDDPRTMGRVLSLLDERADEVARRPASDVRVTRFVEHCRRYFGVLHGCPILIAACYKPCGRVIEEAVADHLGEAAAVAAWNPNLLSLGMAVQNLLLAAHTAGLGMCFHSGPVVFLRGCLQELLGLPPRLELAGLISAGWPAADAEPVRATRKPLDHIVRFAGEKDTGRGRS